MAVNVYQLVTDRIIAELEKGHIPWQKPWTGVRTGAYSHVTGRPYSLLNQLMLMKPGEYLTYKQAISKGGTVRKGEKSQIVVFWKPFEVIKEKEDGSKEKQMIPLLKYYNVFHIDQCEGIKPRFVQEELKPANPIVEAESILSGYSQRTGCRIRNERQDRAFYRPSSDCIVLPLREQFPQIAEYYSTAFHEVTHSTGHASRLNRLNTSAFFGSEDYSKEELIAEMGSAILMNELGIETPDTFRNSAAYIQGWLHALRDDSRLVVSAAGKAEKAVRLILNMDSTEVPVSAA